jgi:hypothetical protein
MHFLNKIGIILLGLSYCFGIFGLLLQRHYLLVLAVASFGFAICSSLGGYYGYPFYLWCKKKYLKWSNQFVDSPRV